jgi:hypothetical protein
MAAACAVMALVMLLPNAAALSQERLASPDAVPGLRVALGDTMDKVRSVYAVRGAPMNDCLKSRPCVMLSAPSEGLRFFFKASDKLLYEIRADAPFSGQIVGVRLGDSVEEVTARLGAPLKPPWGYGGHKAYLFDADPRRLRCDVDASNRCVMLFFWSGSFTS